MEFLHYYFSAILPVLHTLQISHNKLTDAESIEHLAQCDELGVLDLSHNKIDDPKVIDVFERMKGLVSSSFLLLYHLINKLYSYCS